MQVPKLAKASNEHSRNTLCFRNNRRFASCDVGPKKRTDLNAMTSLPRDVSDDEIHPHTIRLRLRDMSQLFNSMDPSPFIEKDLDDDAEEFIVSWAQEFPLMRLSNYASIWINGRPKIRRR